jgi:regulator of protease activity HflC (stomatin/prohibitin superfamily)
MSFELIAGFMPIGVLVVIILLSAIRQVNQYERGVTFVMGRFYKTKMPGWRLVLPIFMSMHKIDMRVKAVDVDHQEAITKDNISIRLNAVIYYKVRDAEKSVIAVENFFWAVSQLAQTTMRNAVGEVTLDELLRGRDQVAEKIQIIVDKQSDPWGIEVEAVELKDVVLPDDLKRTMAKEAEAERERRAVIIKAEGEVMAADNMAKAARTLNSEPGALHLRTLQSINDLSSDQSNTTIWMVPLEVLRAVEAIGDRLKK